MSSTKVKVTFINGNPSEKDLRTFFASKSHSGVQYGPIRRVTELGRNEMLLEFVHAEDVTCVCKRRIYSWKDGSKVSVSRYDDTYEDNGMNVSRPMLDSQDNRTVILEIAGEIHEDDIYGYFDDDDEEVESLDMDTPESGTAKIIFKTIDAKQRVMGKGNITISEIPVKVTDGSKDTATAMTSSCEKMLCISGVDPSWNESVVKSYFKRTGGDIAKYNSSCILNGYVYISFTDNEASERILQKQLLQIKGKQIHAVRFESSVSSPMVDSLANRTVLLEITGAIDEDDLYGYFEDESEEVVNIDVKSGTAKVVFKSVEATQRILRREELLVEGKIIRVKNLSSEIATSFSTRFAKDLNQTLLIYGIHPKWNEGMIKSYFKRCGGEILHYDATRISDGYVEIAFVDKEGITNILEKKQLQIKGTSLHAVRPSDSSSVQPEVTTTRALLVTNIPTATTKDALRYAFQFQFGGGPIRKLDYDKDQASAIVIYENCSGADKVLNKHNLQLESTTIQVSPLDDSYLSDNTCAILVEGDLEKANEYQLKMHFVDGGKIEHVFMQNKRNAVITFTKPDKINEILREPKQTVRNVTLNVWRLPPARPPPLSMAPFEENTLMLRNVFVNTSEKDLKVYMETHSGCKVSSIAFSVTYTGRVLIKFVHKPDFPKIKMKTIQKPFKNKMISVECLPKSSKIQIQNIGEFTTDYLKLTIGNCTGGESNIVINDEPMRHAIAHIPETDLDPLILKLKEEETNMHFKIYHELFGVETLTEPTQTISWASETKESVAVTETSNAVTNDDKQESKFEDSTTERCPVELVGVRRMHKDELKAHLEGMIGEDITIERLDMRNIGKGKVSLTLSDNAASQKLLSKKEIIFEGEDKPIKISQGVPVPLETIIEENIERAVVLEGINPRWPINLIKKSVAPLLEGGEIENIMKDEYDETIAVILYKEPGSAERILEKGKYAWADTEFYTRKYQPEVPFVDVIVTEIPADTTKELLDLYLTDKDASGGGPIHSLVYKQGDEEAVVTFKECEDAKDVLKKSYHCIGANQSPITIKQLDVTYTKQKIGAIHVSAFSNKIHEFLLKLYFSNRRKCGGGKVEDVYYDVENHTAVLTFESHEVVNRIMQKRNHCLEKELLKVKLLESASFPPLIQIHCQPTTLILKQIPRHITSQKLKQYFKQATTCEIRKILYSWEHQGVVQLIFDVIPDFSTVRDHVQQKPIFGSMCAVQKMPNPRSLQIFGIDDVRELGDTLSDELVSGANYLDHQVNAKPIHHCIAHFKYGTDLQDVLSKLKEEIREIQALPYDKTFGLVPPAVSLDSPDIWIPKLIEIDQPAKHVMEFLSKKSTQKDILERTIESMNGYLTWPASADEKLTVNYEASTSLEGTKNWASEIKNKVLSFFTNITEERIDILDDTWASFIDQLTIPNNEYIHHEFDAKSKSLILTGNKCDVNKMQRLAEGLKAKLEEECNIKNTITKTTITLKQHEVFLLDMHNFEAQARTISKNSTIKFDIQNGMIEIEDIPQNIDRIKQAMREITSTIVYKIVAFLPQLVKIAKKNKTFQLLERLLKERSINIYWRINTNGFDLYSLSNEDLSEAENLFLEELIERTIDIGSNQKQTTTTDKWKLFVIEHRSRYGDQVDITILDEKLTVYGTRSEVITLYEDIKRFMESNVKTEEFIYIRAAGVVRYLKENVDKIKQEFDDEPCPTIIPKLDGQRSGFRIKGTQKAYKKADRIIKNMVTNVKHMELPTSQPGIIEYFTQKDGLDIIAGKEKRYGVAIEAVRDTQLPIIDGYSEANESDPVVIKTSVKCNGLTIVAAQANLPTYKCDAIVNAANDRMDHAGGLAGAIAKRGGPEIQEECSRYVRNNGKLVSPTVYVSNPGKLNCKKIIHAVGPIYKSGNDNEESSLFNVIDETLQTATNYNFRVIAIPAISTGIFRYPLAEALKTIVDAIKEFCMGNLGSLHEVHLVDNTDKVSDAMKDALNCAFGVRTHKTRGNVPGLSRHQEKLVEPSTRYGTQNDLIITIPGKLNITVKQGDLTEETTDVIVNGSNSKLELNSAIGPLLIQKAGDGFLAECTAKGRIDNLVEFTTSGNLPCRAVLHVNVSEKMTPDKWKTAFLTCLNKTATRGYTSISFPALGTGKMGRRPEAIADILTDVFKDYMESGNPGISNIRVIVYDRTMARNFQNTLEANARRLAVKEEDPRPHQPARVPSDELNLVIYGESEEIIKKVSDELTDHIASRIEVVTFDSETDQNQIAALNPDQTKRIQQIGEAHNVQVQLKRGRHNCIEIRGEKTSVHAVRKEIEAIMRERTEKAYENILAKQVHWEYSDSTTGDFKQYPDHMNARIEGDYQQKQEYYEWTQKGRHGSTHKRRIVFKDKLEYVLNTLQTPVPVQRIVQDSVDPPPTWSSMSTMATDVHYMEYTVAPSTQEFKDIEAKFLSQTNHRFSIKRMIRIQNPGLYKQLKIKQRQMERTSTTTPMSRQLWHGTIEDAIPLINNGNFNRNFSGRNATVYGKGVYFAVKADYSCQGSYSNPGNDGLKNVYYCTVLTGDYTRGDSSYLDPPAKDATKPHIKYDSVVDNPNNIRMFVIFNDTQAYPDYLIKFK